MILTGADIFSSSAQGSHLQSKQSRSEDPKPLQHWSKTDNLNVSNYLSRAGVLLEPRAQLHKVVIFVR